MKNKEYLEKASFTGLGTMESPYIIEYEKDIIELTKNSSTFENCYFELARDISLSSPITPIGDGITNFNGVFNGQGYSIKNLRISSQYTKETTWPALFGVLGKNAILLNLNVEIKSIYHSGTQDIYAGAICGLNQGAIINCFSYNTTKDSFFLSIEDKQESATLNVGGLVGSNQGYIYNSYTNIILLGRIAHISGADTKVSVGGCAGHSQGYIDNTYSVATLTNSCTPKELEQFLTLGAIVGENELHKGIFNYVYWNLSKVHKKGLEQEESVLLTKRNNALNDDKESSIIKRDALPVDISKRLGIGNNIQTNRNGKDDKPEGDEKKTSAIEDNSMKNMYEVLNKNVFPIPKAFKLNSSVCYWWKKSNTSDKTIYPYPLLKESILNLTGFGTVQNPFIIRSRFILMILLKISVNFGHNFIDMYLKLDRNLNFEGIELEPIGYEYNTKQGVVKHIFEGTLDGGGYTISGLHIKSKNNKDKIGLFTEIGEYACIKNLNLQFDEKGIISENANYVGALVGVCNGTVENCNILNGEDNKPLNIQFTGVDEAGETEYTGSYIGGLIGYLDGSNQEKSILNCSVHTDILIQTKQVIELQVGGIAGYTESCIIDKCNIIGNITLNHIGDAKEELQNAYAGGLLGYVQNTQIKNSFARGSVIANQYKFSETFNAGGLVGMVSSDDAVKNIIKNCYSCSDTLKPDSGIICSLGNTSIARCGGFIGTMWQSDIIKNCYSSHNIIKNSADNDPVGGFGGRADLADGAQYSYIYWNSDANPKQGFGNKDNTIPGGEGDDINGAEGKSSGRKLSEMTNDEFVKILNNNAESTIWGKDENGSNYHLPILLTI